MTTRLFAQVVGVVLLLIGVVGGLLGEGLLGGLFNVDFTEDIIHLVTGGLLAFVGFGRDEANIRDIVVAAVGAVYLLVGVLGFIFPPPYFGAIPSSYTVVDNLIHLALGALALAAVFLWRGGDTAARRRT